MIQYSEYIIYLLYHQCIYSTSISALTVRANSSFSSETFINLGKSHDVRSEQILVSPNLDVNTLILTLFKSLHYLQSFKFLVSIQEMAWRLVGAISLIETMLVYHKMTTQGVNIVKYFFWIQTFSMLEYKKLNWN